MTKELKKYKSVESLHMTPNIPENSNFTNPEGRYQNDNFLRYKLKPMQRSLDDHDLRKESNSPTPEKLKQWHQRLDRRFKLECDLKLQSPKLVKDFKDLWEVIENYSYLDDNQRKQPKPVIKAYWKAIQTFQETINTTLDAKLPILDADKKKILDAKQKVLDAANRANHVLHNTRLSVMRDTIANYERFTPTQKQSLNNTVHNYQQTLDQAINSISDASSEQVDKAYQEVERVAELAKEALRYECQSEFEASWKGRGLRSINELEEEIGPMQQAFDNYREFHDTNQQAEFDHVLKEYQETVENYRQAFLELCDANLRSRGVWDNRVQAAEKQVLDRYQKVNNGIEKFNTTIKEANPGDLAILRRDIQQAVAAANAAAMAIVARMRNIANNAAAGLGNIVNQERQHIVRRIDLE